MTISREDVLHVAELAHLELTAEEAELYRGQLDEILNYMAFANVVSGTPAGAAPRESDLGLRDDVLRPCNIVDAVLDQAPDAAKPFFRVPKVIER
jgi:aspartyl-tRNA(Asn)/glutamyl-tRNA(Gln) amidotransferase subunit C